MHSIASNSQWKWFGASVRGPGHILSGQGNQDAWLGRCGSFGAAIVVCDGLGSLTNSALGAHMACKTVIDSLRLWTHSKGAAPELLFRLIHALWAIRVQPAEPKQCATTCLFAASLADGSLLTAQLGDGLIAIKSPNENVQVIGSTRTGFSNETTGLGIAKNLSEWALKVTPSVLPGTVAMLASDGVADDLQQGKLSGFIDYLQTDFAPLPPRRRWQALASELRTWPVPHHTDDKTVALMRLDNTGGNH
jgi:serine/threonine protein phosphatase PrpC